MELSAHATHSDPWGAHIFGIGTLSSSFFQCQILHISPLSAHRCIELQIARPGTPIPYLCPSYANKVYAQCASEQINWPENISPFGGVVISHTYANETDFCDEFCAPEILGSFCFKYALSFTFGPSAALFTSLSVYTSLS